MLNYFPLSGSKNVVVVQFLSHVRLFVSPWIAACQASLSFSISGVCSKSCVLSWWRHPAISSPVTSFSCPQPFPVSGKVSSLNQVAKVLELHLQSQSSNEYSGLISFQFSSVSQSCLILCNPMTAAHEASLSIINSQILLKLMSIESVMPSNHLALCHHLLLSPLIFPSIGFFFNELVLHIRGTNYWSFSFSISPFNENSGLISFRIDWFYLPTVQGTLKSLLQHHSSKASILWNSAFFIVLHSHPFMNTGKTIALAGWTFVSKVMSLLFNMLSSLNIAFLPRSKPLLISWLQSLSAVILDPQNQKVCHCFHCFTICLPWNDGTRCRDLIFLNVEF